MEIGTAIEVREFPYILCIEGKLTKIGKGKFDFIEISYEAKMKT